MCSLRRRYFFLITCMMSVFATEKPIDGTHNGLIIETAMKIEHQQADVPRSRTRSIRLLQA